MEKIDAVLIESFVLLNRYLKDRNLRYCLIGGIAAGYWGEPRYTRDMDFAVVSRPQGVKALVAQLKKDGFKAVERGEHEIQVFQKGRLRFHADLILAGTEYEDWVVQRAVPVTMFEVEVPICSPEDLIILKLIANRRQDLLDIENVLKNKSVKLDKGYLKKWLKAWELEERYENEFGKMIR